MYVIESHRPPSRRGIEVPGTWLYPVGNAGEWQQLGEYLRPAILGAIATGNIAPGIRENEARSLASRKAPLLAIPPFWQHAFMTALGDNFNVNVSTYADQLELKVPISSREAWRNAREVSRLRRKGGPANPISAWINDGGAMAEALSTPEANVLSALVGEVGNARCPLTADEHAIATNSGANYVVFAARVIDRPDEPSPRLLTNAPQIQAGSIALDELRPTFLPIVTFLRP